MKKRLSFAILFMLLTAFAFAKRLDDSGNYLVHYQGDYVVILECRIKDAEHIDVPATFKGVPVTAIYDKAFSQSASTLQSVTLPDTVTVLGSGVFAGCTKLKSVNIPAGLTEIPDYAFNNCSSLEKVTLPEGLVRIGDNAFYQCTSLESINLPSTLKQIGKRAFTRCEKISTVSISQEVRYIGDEAFLGTEVDEVVIARPTHISATAFDKDVLLYVFRNSQAASAAKYVDGEFLYVQDGSKGDIPDYSDYKKWGGAANDYYTGVADEQTDITSYEDYDNDEEEAPLVTASQLADLVKVIAQRENSNYAGVTTDGTDGIYYVKFEHCSSGSEVSGDFPYIYYLLEGVEEDDVPNMLYLVYGRNTSENMFVYNMAASSLLETEDEEDIRNPGEMQELYNAIQDYTIAYTTKVTINGKEYVVYCTDIDED